MSRGIEIDRHAFASNASSFNTAWETFGWTPAIEGQRAGRLEESVPWASLTARADEPAWLSGRAAEVLAPTNFDRLHFALLPLDDRLGFSIWGAIGARTREGPEWRVLTHTLLFSRDAFDAIAGHPLGLLGLPRKPASWLETMVERTGFDVPAPLDPVRVPDEPAVRAAFEDARLREIARLRDGLLDRMSGDRDQLERSLAVLFEALAATRGGGPVHHVALPSTADRRNELLIRLAWLSLPIEDRATTFFVTEQRRTDHPAATLLALPADEWGRFVPGATQLLDDRRIAAWADISAGRRYWAAAIAGDDFVPLARRAELRGWKLLDRDDIGRGEALAKWSAAWRHAGPDAAKVGALLELERAGARPRLRAVGHVAALAAMADAFGRDAEGRAARLLDLFAGLPAPAARTVVCAVVRTLARGDADDRAAAGFVRCLSVLSEPPVVPLDEVLRLLDTEKRALDALRTSDAGARLLMRAATAAAHAGHFAAIDLPGEALRTLDAGNTLRRIAAHASLDDPRAARWVVQVVGRMESLGIDVPIDALLPAAWVARSGEMKRVFDWCSGPGDPWPRLALLSDEGWAAEGDGVAPMLIRRAADVAPPGDAPARWLDLVGSADARWLMLSPVLGAFVDALSAAADEAGENDAGRAVAAKLLARIRVRMDGGSLSDAQVDTVLRLMWIEDADGDGASLDAIASMVADRALPLLVRLLVAPAPLPIFLRLRRMLLELAPAVTAAPDIAPEWSERLHEYAPAVAYRIARTRRPPTGSKAME